MTQVGIRHYNPDIDSGYVYSTWIQYSFYSPKEPVKVSKDQFFKDKARAIKDLLEKASVRIACLREDPYIILGYIVYFNHRVEWICIKKDFRSEEIERLLLNSVKEDYDRREEDRTPSHSQEDP